MMTIVQVGTGIGINSRSRSEKKTAPRAGRARGCTTNLVQQSIDFLFFPFLICPSFLYPPLLLVSLDLDAVGARSRPYTMASLT